MVYSISRSLPAPAPRASPPQYQAFLTPLLHRRFAHACLISLGFCYALAFLISNKPNPFWTILPFSWTGPKCAVLFFFSAMPILILRIAQLHVVKRAFPSPLHTLKRSIGSFVTYSTIITYMFASGTFTTLYLLSCTDKDQLGVVIEGRSYERPRLNERFLYLCFFSIYVGLWQGIHHVYKDRARLEFPEVPVTSPQEAARKMIPLVNWNLGLLTIGPAVTAPFAYLPFRQIVWSNTLWVARSFYWLNRSTALPPYPVGPGLFIRSTVMAAMIVLSAEVAHVAFTVYFLEQPFANNKLVSDKSPNPNGTLVTGLRTSKAPLTQFIAFWELDFLSSERPDRRKAIYNDVDRKPSTTWEQILSECLRTLSEVNTSVSRLIIPPAPEPVTPPAENLALTAPLSSPPPIPMSPAPFVSTGRSPGRSFVESMQSTTGETPDKLVRSRLPPLPEEMNAPIVQARENLNSLKEYTVPMLASTFGYPLRHTIARTTSAAIPNHRVICHAISALAKLTVASLEEDDYGVVQNHVVGILKAFLETLETLERFLEKPPIHWTDTESKLIMEQGGKPEMIEAEEVAKELKDAVKEIGGAFMPHFEDMGCPRELQNKVATVLGIY